MDLPPLTRIPGVHNGSFLYYLENDGYFYSRSRQRGNTTYFRCSKSGSGCRSTAVLCLGQFQSSFHNHPPNPLHVPLMMERQRLVDMAANLNYVSFAEIMDDTRNMFPGLLTQHGLQPAMSRMRSHSLPLEPTTLRDLDVILKDEAYKCLCATRYFEDTIYGGSIESEDGCFVILLLSRKCREFMKLSITLFTFTTLYKKQGGIEFTVHAMYTEWDGTFIILAWFCLEQKTQQSLTAAFSYLKSVLECTHFKYIVCQLGSLEAIAYKTVFSTVSVTFCLQDLVRNLTSYLHSVDITLAPRLTDIASLLCALLILPSDFTHLCILQEVTKLEETLLQQANLLIEYAQSNWWNVLGDFSVCGDYHRTSDINETVQRKVLQVVSTHKNSLYSLIRDIVYHSTLQDVFVSCM